MGAEEKYDFSRVDGPGVTFMHRYKREERIVGVWRERWGAENKKQRVLVEGQRRVCGGIDKGFPSVRMCLCVHEAKLWGFCTRLGAFRDEEKTKRENASRNGARRAFVG